MGQRLPAELSGGQQQRVRGRPCTGAGAPGSSPRRAAVKSHARLRRRVRTESANCSSARFHGGLRHARSARTLAVSDRIIVMKDGSIAQEGAPRELYETAGLRFIADFMAKPMSLLRRDHVDGHEARSVWNG